jgi:glycosyltransferase involved in cell wall biosynthesis
VKLKIYIIGSAGVPARYGGFETFAENLSVRLSIDFEVFVICSTKKYSQEKRQHNWNNIHRIFFPIRPNGIQSLIYDFISLLTAQANADFIIMLGSGSGLILPLFRIFKKLPIAVHIDGLEWKRGKWNRFARLFLWLNYKLCLCYARYIIADNKALIKNIPAKYRYKVVEISYGYEHNPDVNFNPYLFNKPYALVIARAEPENNLEMIINAFKTLSNLSLIIISNCEYTKYGRWLLKNSSGLSNLQIIGPVYEDRVLLQQYRMGCSVYIHGHSAGGTNPSLIEAMATGKPVLAFDNEFNRVTTNNKAYYFDNTMSLLSLINSINDDEFLISAQNLKQYTMQEYNWDKVSDKFASLIKQECERNTK